MNQSAEKTAPKPFALVLEFADGSLRKFENVQAVYRYSRMRRPPKPYPKARSGEISQACRDWPLDEERDLSRFRPASVYVVANRLGYSVTHVGDGRFLRVA